MGTKWRDPPEGCRRASERSVAADGFDTFRNNPYRPRKQASYPRALGPGERAAGCIGSALDSVPTAFDATANPIVEPFRRVGDVAAMVVAGLARDRQDFAAQVRGQEHAPRYTPLGFPSALIHEAPL